MRKWVKCNIIGSNLDTLLERKLDQVQRKAVRMRNSLETILRKDRLNIYEHLALRRIRKDLTALFKYLFLLYTE